MWSWDITKLRGPAKWTSYYLYVVLDVYSRYVVGWLIAPKESAKLAETLLADTIAKQGVAPDQLTVHSDRGSSMASKPVAFLLADLGVTKSHSRPRCSNDNPFSEAQFKTLKYCPDFPQRFGSIEDARAFCRRFFGLLQHRPPPQRHRPDDALPTSTTAAPSRSDTSAPPSSSAPTTTTATASSADNPSRPPSPAPPGSTSPTTPTRTLTDSRRDLPQKG